MVTDLLDEVKYPAEAMLDGIRAAGESKRFSTRSPDVFSLRHLIGTMPKAVLFQMSFCLLMYNALQVVARDLASYQACEAKKISNDEVVLRRGAADGGSRARVRRGGFVARVARRGTVAAELRECMREGLPGAWSDRCVEAPSSGRRRHQKVKTRVSATIRRLIGFEQTRKQRRQAPTATQRP